ncbi:hypothetical protein GQ42DRAFT_62471 [Ramicandelaber brevisporus]|nr:hypothetical protein GQ42DRAFT_62471 [Ramicandelaber brevisporus]
MKMTFASGRTAARWSSTAAVAVVTGLLVLAVMCSTGSAADTYDCSRVVVGSYQYNLSLASPHNGDRHIVRNSSTWPTWTLSDISVNLCHPLSHDVSVPDEDQCLSANHPMVCMIDTNYKHGQPRVVRVRQFADSDKDSDKDKNKDKDKQQPQQPKQPPPQEEEVKTSGGLFGWLVTLISIVAFIYIGVGISFNYIIEKRRGWDTIPNREFWREMPYLTMDFVRHLWQSFNGRASSNTNSGYSPL